MEHLNIEEIQAAQAGDDEAFARIVQHYLPTVFSFIAHYTGDDTLAEDVVQITFVKVWKNLHRFDASRPLYPWLLQIARNTAHDELRKRRAKPFSRMFSTSDTDEERSFADTLVDPEPLPPEIFESKQNAEMLTKALATLPERDRAVLLLRYIEGLPFNEIAEHMKVPLNTVKSWHRRALIRLRPLLAPYEG